MTESPRQLEQNVHDGPRQPVKWLIATVKESDTTVTIQFPLSAGTSEETSVEHLDPPAS